VSALSKIERRALLLRIESLEEVEAATLDGFAKYLRTHLDPLLAEVRQARVEMLKAADLLGRGRNRSEAAGLRSRAAKLEALMRGTK
jgi:hypothetical protein